MITHALRHSRWSLVALAAAAVLAGCDDDDKSAFAPSEPPVLAVGGAVDLGECDEIAAPAGSVLVFHAYADGVQIYRWNGSSWVPQGPSATLYADADHKAKVGTHYAGPRWESNGGSIVVGRLNKPCEVGPANIPWLLLDGAGHEGRPGIFQDVTSIQRVNTVGGRAPIRSGDPGEVRNVPYTAEYYFYRAP